jgi:hypothetical protein
MMRAWWLGWGMVPGLVMAGLAQGTGAAPAAGTPGRSKAVLVELFTSEGCSSCPPADALLRQIDGTTTAAGQLIVGLSEHVSYWDGLGWKDRFSSELYTRRQNAYGSHFGLDSVYTPQMVVNGREQFVGGDRGRLEASLAAEARRKQVDLQITSARVEGSDVVFGYRTAGLPEGGRWQVVAVLTDDVDRTSVERGENSGRKLVHVSVARAMNAVGALKEGGQEQLRLALPAPFEGASGHHLVVFAQEDGVGAVVGVDVRKL